VKNVRKTGFYPRLAAQSIRKNGKFYLPYLLTCVGTAAMFYIMLFLNGNKGLQAMPGAGSLQSALGFGTVVIALFSAVLLFYTNSFLMKRRKKELGLYNILGMEKRHIARILAWETAYTALIGIVGGILAGILLSKLLLLLLCSLLRFDIPFGFSVELPGMSLTAAVFCAIFALNLLVNLGRIHLAKPIELLLGGSVGERDPKTRWLPALVGILTLGTGYAIAVTVQSPLSALWLFFIAVILVIIGTYCLFTAGSIAVLKLLRKNKAYYYQTKHFAAVSGMLHRMKRNAAGLASICILSTMVLVTVSTTLSLYLGVEDVLAARFPHDISLTLREPGEGTVEEALAKIQAAAAEQNMHIEKLSATEYLEFTVKMEGDKMTNGSGLPLNGSDIAIVHFITTEEYERQTGRAVSLESGEVLAQPAGREIPDSFELLGRRFTVRETIADIDFLSEESTDVVPVLSFVVSPSDMEDIVTREKESYSDNASSLSAAIYLDLAGTDEEKLAYYDSISNALAETVTGEYVDENGQTQTYEYRVLYAESRAAGAESVYTMWGGFFFLGLFLGTLFLMATVLIIYYKQISEGYEDADRFQIMQKVGMSEREVRASVRSQILIVFFLPLTMASVHIAAAFPMITRLLTLFNLNNVGLFAWCTLGTVLVFALIYGLVYALTARAYYQIVKT
jgi:putative ABC transport system permease protein